MSIWNKILIGFVFIAAVAFFYLALRTLKTHQHWREKAAAFQERVEELDDENRELVLADPEEEDAEETEMGIERLRLELFKLLIDRGRVWYNCSPDPPDAQTGQVPVKTDLPDPHRISQNTVLYVFEEADVADDGNYLGEFKVTQVADRQIALAPTAKMPAEDLARLAASRGPWTLYEVMPIDTRSVFATLSEEEKEALLPEATVDEYLKDGKPADPDDPEDRVVDDGEGGKLYSRMLRDYDVLFENYHLRRSYMADKVAVARRDKQYIDQAYGEALRQKQFRDSEEQSLLAEMAKYGRERDAVIALGKVLSPRVMGMKTAVQRLIESNLATAAQIAKYQFDAARRIDARTRSMVQNGTGSN